MACAGCGKNRKASGRSYLECPVCFTILHGPSKANPEINEHRVCGSCYKKYKIIKELEKAKKITKKIKELEKAKPKKVKK